MMFSFSFNSKHNRNVFLCQLKAGKSLILFIIIDINVYLWRQSANEANAKNEEWNYRLRENKCFVNNKLVIRNFSMIDWIPANVGQTNVAIVDKNYTIDE